MAAALLGRNRVAPLAAEPLCQEESSNTDGWTDRDQREENQQEHGESSLQGLAPFVSAGHRANAPPWAKFRRNY